MPETGLYSSILLLLSPLGFSPRHWWLVGHSVNHLLSPHQQQPQAGSSLSLGAHLQLALKGIMAPRDSTSDTRRQRVSLSSACVSLGTSWSQQSRNHFHLIPVWALRPLQRVHIRLECGGDWMPQQDCGFDGVHSKAPSFAPSLHCTSCSSSGTSIPLWCPSGLGHSTSCLDLLFFF